MTNTAKRWSYLWLQRQSKGLNGTALDRAMKHEPTPQFPGVDIDAIHYRPAQQQRRAA